MLHVAQASVKIDKVLLHLVHALGEVGGEDLESYFQLCRHVVVVAHGVIVADTRCVRPLLGMVVAEEEGGAGRKEEREQRNALFFRLRSK